MICIPVIVICDDCKEEVEQRIPLTQGMMNLIAVDASVSPEGWGYKSNKLVCPTCLNKRDLKLVKED